MSRRVFFLINGFDDLRDGMTTAKLINASTRMDVETLVLELGGLGVSLDGSVVATAVDTARTPGTADDLKPKRRTVRRLERPCCQGSIRQGFTMTFTSLVI